MSFNHDSYYIGLSRYPVEMGSDLLSISHVVGRDLPEELVIMVERGY